MSAIIRIKEQSPTLGIDFVDGSKKRTLGEIGHPVEGRIDWKKTAKTVRMSEDEKGLEIELIPK